MFSIFKKKEKNEINGEKFEIELTASVLAYEIARSDGNISKQELVVLLEEVKKIADKVGKSKNEILDIIKIYSENNVSFYDFIKDINKNYTKENKLALLEFLWNMAYADSILEVNEERLIRRIANMINIKDIEVLKLKNQVKNKN
jgi:uncharacterized tellurite resistance protein B-like protein